MTTIVLSALETGSNTDILQATRLQTLMEGGVLSLECGASDAVAANNYVMSLQLPAGHTPFNGVLVPQGGPTAGVAGVLDDRMTLKYRAVIGKGGGHPVFSIVETGDTEFMWRIVYQDNR